MTVNLTTRLQNIGENVRDALTQIAQTGEFDHSVLVQRYIELHPKFQNLELKGDDLNEYFKTKDSLEQLYGTPALDGGLQRVITAWQNVQESRAVGNEARV